MKKTVLNFWRMVWEYKVQAIIMLTSCIEMGKVSHCTLLIFFKHAKWLQKKCFQYWPKTLHENITPGHILKVTLSQSTLYAEYEVRKFKVKNVSSHYIGITHKEYIEL